MKKEYLILAVTIVALSAYLFIHNKNRSNYTLPSMDEVSVTDISAIKIEKAGNILNINKKDETWGITDKNYPADADAVSKMLDIIKDLRLTALVSENQDLQRYELDDENRITVTAGNDARTLRKFEIGKTASSYRHTFIRINGDDNVYHAAKSFRRDFDKSVDELRDKSVLSFDKKEITGLILEKDGIKKELVLKEIAASSEDSDDTDKKPDTSSEGDSASRENDGGKEADSQDVQEKNEPLKIWTFKEGEEVPDDEPLDRLLSTLSSIKCSKFADTDTKASWMEKKMLCSINLTGKREISLKIFFKNDKENYPALSSENPYPFLFDTYQGENLISSIDTLLGIEKKENTEETEKQ